MSEVRIIVLDLARHLFQVQGTDASGQVVIPKQLRRGQVLEFFGRQPRCVVAMEACSSAHCRGREMGRLGYEVRLILPAYVKPL